MTDEKKEPTSVNQTAIGDENIQVVGSNNIITRIKNLKDEIGNINALLATLIIVQIVIYLCAFSLVGIANDKAAIGLLEAYFFCLCFPFMFGPFSLWGLVRALQLRKPKTITLGCFASFLSIIVFLIIAILMFALGIAQQFAR